jgi:hypothetical protein
VVVKPSLNSKEMTMGKSRLTRRERIQLACAAATGLLSGVAREVARWLLDCRT